MFEVQKWRKLDVHIRLLSWLEKRKKLITQAGRRIGSRAAKAFSDPYCQLTWRLACMIASNDDIIHAKPYMQTISYMSNHANFTLPMRTSLFYATCCKSRG